MRIHTLSRSARKQKAEECQTLQPGSKCPCSALWGSCPCTHSLLDTLGPVWSQPGQQAHQLPQEPPDLPHSPGTLQALAQGTCFVNQDLPSPYTSLGTHADGCPASQDSQPVPVHAPSTCFTLKLHLPRGEHSPAGRFCSP